jgi:radical SAM superfamily enzyme YgiQ (UPF0313 family)
LRCEQLDLFYMIGLPGQTRESVEATVDAIGALFERFDRRLSAFVTPMGPFIDPGSHGFAEAAARGYRLRAHTSPSTAPCSSSTTGSRSSTTRRSG